MSLTNKKKGGGYGVNFSVYGCSGRDDAVAIL